MKNKVLHCPGCKSEVKPFKLLFKNKQCNSCGTNFYVSTEQKRFHTFIGLFIGFILGLLLSNGRYLSFIFLLAIVFVIYLSLRRNYETYAIEKIV